MAHSLSARGQKDGARGFEIGPRRDALATGAVAPGRARGHGRLGCCESHVASSTRLCTQSFPPRACARSSTHSSRSSVSAAATCTCSPRAPRPRECSRQPPKLNTNCHVDKPTSTALCLTATATTTRWTTSSPARRLPGCQSRPARTTTTTSSQERRNSAPTRPRAPPFVRFSPPRRRASTAAGRGGERVPPAASPTRAPRGSERCTPPRRHGGQRARRCTRRGLCPRPKGRTRQRGAQRAPYALSRTPAERLVPHP